ncbi:MAG: ABC transporter ATP-binding protein [Alphaproteobacteria bacterium]|nr:ABC transporter ATP-binding protein [Alphaproteobacteria bacterium]
MLEATDIIKRFGGLVAVSDASLTVPEGRIVSLIGPNGAGKTTLFAVISGFLKPDAGRITFAGTDVTGMRPHEVCRLGLVRTFQVVQPFANLTVRENIAAGAHNRIRGRAEALDHAGEVGKRLGMGGMLDQPAGALTVAGRKRLELSRALATGPKLLLLDEVMAGLNATEITEIVEVIRGIRDTGITILLIEHVMQAVMSLSDYTYVLNNGAIISRGAPREVAADPQVVEAYLGHGASERIAAGGAGA